VALLAVSAMGWAQTAPAQSDPAAQDQGWRRLGNPSAAAQPAGDPAQSGAPAVNDPPPPPPLPATLTIAPGTFFTIRINQPLSSDHNKVGDLFTASLAKPIIVNGVVVADRGQTVAGRVAEVDKGGLLKGSTKLGIELTELTLIDGSQMPVHSQLISISGPGVGGRNAAVIAGTTVTGAAVGGIVGAGQGAAIGAGAGAAVGLLGALATRGYPTIIRPEAMLTFRMDQPIVVATDHAPQAFRYAGPGDYDQPRFATTRPGGPPPPYYGAGYVGGYPYYPYYGYGYGYGYPYYGPGIGIGVYGRFGGRWR
jgi:hypothetical protein